jgi:hypothetical protein
MDAPNESCLLLNHPGNGGAQTVWLYGIWWEALA